MILDFLISFVGMVLVIRGHLKRNELIGVLIIDGRSQAGARPGSVLGLVGRKGQHQIFSA